MTKYTVTTRSGSVYQLTHEWRDRLEPFMENGIEMVSDTAEELWLFTGIKADGKGSPFVGVTVHVVLLRSPVVGGYLDLYCHSEEPAWPATSREIHTSRIVDINTEDA